jgi:ABC-type transport system involved in cytochrome bd biosynthesis fused ATPase/permease subunit
MTWAANNPAKGAVACLLVLAVGLWVLRRTLKVFIGLVLILAVLVIGSYFFVGGKETNAFIRDGARDGLDKAEELQEGLREEIREELLRPVEQ